METVEGGNWRPATTMPEWVARQKVVTLTLEVKRLLEVTGDDMVRMGLLTVGKVFSWFESSFPECPWWPDNPHCWVARVKQAGLVEE